MGKQYSSAAVRIDGLKELQRQMKLLAPSIRAEFNKEMFQVAAIVITEVRAGIAADAERTAARDAMAAQEERRKPRGNRSTGRAAASVHPNMAGGSVNVFAGGAKVPYYPWLDFGGSGVVGWKKSKHGRYKKKDKRPFVKEGRFIYPSVKKVRKQVYKAGLDAVRRAKLQNGLR